MDHEQELVEAILKATPPPDVRGDFLARVNARIDEAPGWFALADFRLWTLRLAPAAAGLAFVAVFWAAPAASTTAAGTSPSQSGADAASTFSPASSTDWQQDVSADALLEAALRPAGGANVR